VGYNGLEEGDVMAQLAEKRGRKTLYLVWLIPLVAMAIAGWMIFKYYDNKGYDIVITFNDAEGFVVGKTPLMYNGFKLGHITNMEVSLHDISKVDVTITVDHETKAVAREGNLFLKVAPKLSLTEVTGLSTILSGAYIEVFPAHNTIEALQQAKEVFHFTAIEERPVSVFNKGLNVIVTSDEADVKAGAPVLYKQFNVGSVAEVRLTHQGVEYQIHLDQKYMHLLKKDSKFWQTNGFEASASLAGVDVEMSSLATFVAGGISFDSPPHSPTVDSHNQQYKLYKNYTESRFGQGEDDDTVSDENYFEQEGIRVVLTMDNLGAINRGTPLYYKGIPAGKVQAYQLDKNGTQVEATLFIMKKFAHLVNDSTFFYDISGVDVQAGLEGVEIKMGTIEAIVTGGIAFKTPHEGATVKEMHTFRLYPDEKAYHETFVNAYLTLQYIRDLKVGSKIKLDDYTIGHIASITINKGKIEAIAKINTAYAFLLNSKTLFWRERLVVDVDQVKNIETLFGGSYLAVQTTDGGHYADHFNVSEITPPKTLNEPGLRLKVTTDRLGSLGVDSPLFYRQMPIGSIESYQLKADGTGIEMVVYVDPCYAYVIHTDSKFYMAGAIGVDVSLFGVKIETETITTMIRGGINVVTPKGDSPRATEMEKFFLYNDPDDDWLEWKPVLPGGDEACLQRDRLI
jgi:paraquat-inducible protein B